MLIENAIKHNIITEKEPLVISIVENGAELIVSNTLNRAPSEVSSGTGISNIQKRYSHFTDKSVHVSEQNGKFEVRIPLLEIEHS